MFFPNIFCWFLVRTTTTRRRWYQVRAWVSESNKSLNIIFFLPALLEKWLPNENKIYILSRSKKKRCKKKENVKVKTLIRFGFFLQYSVESHANLCWIWRKREKIWFMNLCWVRRVERERERDDEKYFRLKKQNLQLQAVLLTLC